MFLKLSVQRDCTYDDCCEVHWSPSICWDGVWRLFKDAKRRRSSMSVLRTCRFASRTLLGSFEYIRSDFLETLPDSPSKPLLTFNLRVNVEWRHKESVDACDSAMFLYDSRPFVIKSLFYGSLFREFSGSRLPFALRWKITSEPKKKISDDSERRFA